MSAEEGLWGLGRTLDRVGGEEAEGRVGGPQGDLPGALKTWAFCLRAMGTPRGFAQRRGEI